MEEIASLLKEAREEAGISLDEVSKDLQIDKLILMNVEEGKIGAFKDIFLLRDNISEYAKYLGLDYEKLLAEFNEYFFEYTSKIPVAEIEKEIKDTKDESDIASPYTFSTPKNKSIVYVLIYIALLILVVLAIFWSINQITVNKSNAYVISYRK